MFSNDGTAIPFYYATNDLQSRHYCDRWSFSIHKQPKDNKESSEESKFFNLDKVDWTWTLNYIETSNQWFVNTLHFDLNN